jgi:hypothetical protein
MSSRQSQDPVIAGCIGTVRAKPKPAHGARRVMGCELRLRSWPGGTDRLLGTGDVHLAPVDWVG